MLLAGHVAPAAAQYAAGRRVRTPEIASETLAALQAYDWPGNVRQLRNVVERTIILAPGDRIGRIDVDLLPPEVMGARLDAAEEHRGLVGEHDARSPRLLAADDVHACVPVRDHFPDRHEVGVAPGVVEVMMRVEHELDRLRRHVPPCQELVGLERGRWSLRGVPSADESRSSRHAHCPPVARGDLSPVAAIPQVLALDDVVMAQNGAMSSRWYQKTGASRRNKSHSFHG